MKVILRSHPSLFKQNGKIVTLLICFLFFSLALRAQGTALHFDGVDDYVSLGNSSAVKPMGVFSVGVWVKRDWSTPARQAIVSNLYNNKGFSLGIEGQNNGYGTHIAARIHRPDGTLFTWFDGAKLTPGWHYVAFVFNSLSLALYVDGIEVDNHVLGAQNSQVTYELYSSTLIGAKAGPNDYPSADPDSYFLGSLDELRFYNFWLSAAEIKADMLSSTSVKPSALMAHYDFEAQVPVNMVLADKSGNSHSGELRNFGFSGTSSNWVESYAMVVPTATEATGIGSDSFTANWTAPTTGIADSYLLEVATDANFASPIIGSPFTVNALSKTVNGLNELSTYFYRVRAEKNNSPDQGAPSGTKQVSTTIKILTPPGNALDFDGVDDHVLTAKQARAISNRFTVMVWVKPTDGFKPMHIISTSEDVNYGFELSILWGNRILAKFGNSSTWVNDNAVATYNYPVNQWTHLCYVADGSNYTVYANGKQVGNGSLPGAYARLLDLERYLTLGKNFGGNTYFKGSMDEVKVFDIALSPAQVAQEMIGNNAALSPNLMLYYNFDAPKDRQFNTLSDQSGKGYHGTLKNFALTGTVSNWVESYAMVQPISEEATNLTEDGFTASWLAPSVGSIDNGYVLDVATDIEFKLPITGSPFAVNALHKELSGVDKGGIFYYRVRADKHSVTGQGANSATKKVVMSMPQLSPPGSALKFDGVDDYISLGNSAAFRNYMISIGVWVYRPDWSQTTAQQPIIDNTDGGGYTLYLGDNAIDCSINAMLKRTDGLTTNVKFNTAQLSPGWHHVAFTYGGKEAILYVDGNLAAQKTYNESEAIMYVFGTTTSTLIGAHPAGDDAAPSGFFSGSLDELRIYKEILSNAEIRADMQSASSVRPTALIAHYNFDMLLPSANTTLFDKTANRRDGVLRNFNFTGSSGKWLESYAMALASTTDATQVGTTSFTANWTAPTIGTANQYTLEVATDANFNAAITGSPFTVGALSKEITNVNDTTTYYYRVKASKAIETGQSTFLNSKQVTTKLAPLPAPGNALNFDGVDDYISTERSTATIMSPYTVMLWVRPDEATKTMHLFSTREGIDKTFDIQLVGGNKIHGNIGNQFKWLTNSADANYNYKAGQWMHVCYVVNGTKYTIYANGLEVGSGTMVTGDSRLMAYNYYFTLGRNLGENTYFKGSMDEVKVFNTALSEAQVAQEMLGQGLDVAANLIMYHKFDLPIAKQFTKMADNSGKGYHAQLNNFALTGTTSNWEQSYAMVQPKALAATRISTTGFTANWAAPVNGTLDEYILEVASDINFVSPIAGSPFTLTALEKEITGLSEGIYYYRVRAHQTNTQVRGVFSKTITVVAGVRDQLSVPGTALNFDGVNDYVSLGSSNSFKPVTQLSVGLWVNRANWNVAALQTIIGNTQGGGYSLHIGNQDATSQGKYISVSLYRNGSYARPNFDASGLTPGWHYVAFTYDGKVTTLYVDGIAVSNNVAPANYPIAYHASNSTLIGAEADVADVPSAGRYFNGSLDELRIYSVVLTAAEISADMLSANPVKVSDLVAQYRFDKILPSTSNLLLDHNGSDRYGVLYNFAFTGATSNWVESYAMVQPLANDATDLSTNGFTANWTAPAYGTVDHYLLEVALDANFTLPIAGSPFIVNTLSKQLSNLNDGSAYYYRVKADKSTVTGQGLVSNIKQVNTVPASLGLPGTTLNFDGIDDHVVVEKQARTLSGSFTVMAWVMPTDVTKTMHVFSTREGTNNTFDIQLVAGNKIHANIGNGTAWLNANAAASYNYTSNQWLHVCYVVSGNTYIIYANGKALANGTLSGTTPVLLDANHYITLGKNNAENTYFKGSMDEVKVFDVALSPAQVAEEMMNNGTSLVTNRVIYYNFDKLLPSTSVRLPDHGANGYHGTLRNFALTGTTSNWLESYAMVQATAMEVSNVASAGFTANWQAPINGQVDDYLLDVALDANFTMPINGSPFSVTGLSKEFTELTPQAYYYRVRANKNNVMGKSLVSDTKQITLTKSFSPPGTALKFDGVNDYVNLGASNLLKPTAQMSVGVWVNRADWNVDVEQIMVSNYAYMFGIATNKGFDRGKSIFISISRLATRTLTLAFDASKLTPGWHYVAFTYDGKITKLYVDGQVVATDVASESYTMSTGFSTMIGTLPYTNNQTLGWNFNGSLDELRLYNTALTEAEVKADMLSINSVNPTNLIAHYNFGENLPSNGTSLLDLGPNALHGTLVNFTLLGTASNWTESYAMVVPKVKTASAISSNSFKASWDAPMVGQADSYVLDVATNANFTAPISGSPFTVTALEKEITGLAAVSTYYYRVRANKTSINVPGVSLQSMLVTTDKMTQTIAFAALDPKTTASADFTLAATASSGLAVSYQSSNTLVAEVYQDAGVWKVKIKGVGTANITAKQEGDATYFEAPVQIQTLNVSEEVLPVTLSSYTAKIVGQIVKLDWLTASEWNNKRFEIYRSGDDNHFVKLGEVAAKGTATAYAYEDKMPLNGNNYYRLVQVDLDGKPTALGERVLNFDFFKPVVQIYPNPTNGKASIIFAAGKYSLLTISSVEGKVLGAVSIKPHEDKIEIDLGQYPVGIYFIKLQGTVESLRAKIVKQ